MRVLFWGTPDFALPPLRALLGEGFEVTGVVTQPDRAQGRSRSIVVPPPVKQLALENQLPVFQPESPREPEFLELLQVMAPDISVVVAYGHILPKRVIDLPALGTVNIHASLLPDLRGAAPIQAAIRAGRSETGVTIMRMVPALDAGPIILQSRTPILEDESYGDLQLRLSELGALALVEALALLSVGEASETPQDDARATYAPKLTRESARVDWSLPSAAVSRAIRSCDPTPGAFTTLRGAEVKVYCAKQARLGGGGTPGTVLDIAEEGALVACGTGAVHVGVLQPAGQRRIPASDWARGRRIAPGDRFGS